LAALCPSRTCAPPEGWWSMTMAWGSANRFPAAPPANSSDPIDAAWPMHIVCTAGRMYCMVS
jgi:hypothetical protein